MLAKQEHRTLADVLRATTGLQLVRRPVECGGGFAAASGRSGTVTWEPWMSCYNNIRFQPACYFAVYLDGVRVYVPGSKEPVNINDFTVNNLEGVELYRGPAEMPIEYQATGTACGAVLLWTRVS